MIPPEFENQTTKRFTVQFDRRADWVDSKCGGEAESPCQQFAAMKLWPVGQVRPIRFHHIRHTTASLLMMAGADLAAVQRIMRAARRLRGSRDRRGVTGAWCGSARPCNGASAAGRAAKGHHLEMARRTSGFVLMSDPTSRVPRSIIAPGAVTAAFANFAQIDYGASAVFVRSLRGSDDQENRRK
jgi:hypothetical protein